MVNEVSLFFLILWFLTGVDVCGKGNSFEEVEVDAAKGSCPDSCEIKQSQLPL